MSDIKYIGIVGSSKATTTQNVVDTVCSILDRYNKINTTIVSGGAKGIDTIAVDIARSLDYDVLEFLPKGIGWQYYKPRNILIANKCDKVYSIALPLTQGSITVNGTNCYHCKRVGNNSRHFKTAGCWTANQCKEHEVLVA